MNSNLTVADIDPNKIAFAENKPPILSNSVFVYEHLLYYCSKFFPIPVIEAEIKKDSIIATGRQIYLMIAKDLNLPTIRAVVSKGSDQSVVSDLAERGEIKLLDYQKLRDEEKAIDYALYLYFFERPLSQAEKEAFMKPLIEHFNNQSYLKNYSEGEIVKSVIFSHSDTCAEFEALTPFESHDWATELLRRLFRFHNEVAKIVSFRGSKFGI